jgi:tRNA pseudouridine38-40 synthase
VEQVTCEKVRVTGSGRTDAGVHAKGQVAHFTTDKESIPPQQFVKALNAHLPEDIRVLCSERVDDSFDACRGAKRKTYKYSTYISQTNLPLKDRYAVKLDRELNVNAVKECAKLFVGEHDFKGFCASGSSVKTTVRTIYDLSVDVNGEDLTFTITGNGFLYNMVRIIVGTLIKVGEGKATKTDVENMLLNGERALGGKTLPARALCLEKVEY